MSQADEAKPYGTSLAEVEELADESKASDEPEPIEDDDSDVARWRAEKAAQRLDYSGLSDVSSEFFDFDRLEEDTAAEEARQLTLQEDEAQEELKSQPMQVDSKRSAEHQPQRKRNRSDDAWWQARREMEIGSIEDGTRRDTSPTIDAVRRGGEKAQQAAMVQGR